MIRCLPRLRLIRGVQVFGRRFTIIMSLAFLAAGSAICGAAPTMNVLIAGRSKPINVCFWTELTHLLAVQGVGGGSVASICAIIISDLVPLRERGVFNGIIGMCVPVPPPTTPR
jgi:MFS family permease